MNVLNKLDDNYKFEATIFRRLNAFLMLKQEGFESACNMYPEEIQFLTENKEKAYAKIKIELFRKLERV